MTGTDKIGTVPRRKGILQPIGHGGKVQKAATVGVQVRSSGRQSHEERTKEEGRSVSRRDLIGRRPRVEETFDGSSGLKAPNHLEIRNSDRHVASTDGKTNIGVGTGEGSDGDAGAAGLEQAREAASVDVAGVER